MKTQEEVNTICFWLIKNLCTDTNATEGTVTLNKVTYKGEQLGDWEIIVRKKELTQSKG